MSDPSPALAGIQDVAVRLGVTMRALRFYEDKGLIAPRRVGTKRIYTRKEVARMRLILRGKQLGFTLREIGEFLDLYEADPGHLAQARRTLERVRTRLASLEKQRAALEQTIVDLRQIESEALNHIGRAATSNS